MKPILTITELKREIKKLKSSMKERPDSEVNDAIKELLDGVDPVLASKLTNNLM